MDRPIYEYVPRWMFVVVESKTCEKCQQPSTRKDICAVGLRTFDQNRTTFYVEHQCSKCHTRIITSFGAQKTGSTEDLCYILLEQMQAQKKLQKSQEIEKSHGSGKIRDEEVESLLKFMRNTESHEEFMKFIGSKESTPKNDED